MLLRKGENMRRIPMLAVLLGAFSAIMPAHLVADPGKPRMIDIKTILSKIGIKEEGGSIDSSNDIVRSIPRSERAIYGSIEGVERLLDTPEEFITAIWFYPIEIKDAKYLAQVNQELPPGKPGALKLCAMWMEKRAVMQSYLLDNDSKKEQIARYDLIIKTLMKKGQINEVELKAYYTAAITNSMASLVRDIYNVREYTTQDKAFNLSVKRLIKGYEVSINGADPVTVNSYDELAKYGLSKKQIDDELNYIQFPVDSISYGQHKLLVTSLIDYFLAYPNNDKEYKMLSAIPYLYFKNRTQNNMNMDVYSPSFFSILKNINKDFSFSIDGISFLAMTSKINPVTNKKYADELLGVLPAGFESELCVLPTGGVITDALAARREVDKLSANFPYTPKAERKGKLY
jgi:hypothetical protein